MLISNGKKKIANPQIIPPNSCENFRLSRISADKRFLMYFHYIPLRSTPDRGLVQRTQPDWRGVRNGLHPQNYEYFLKFSSDFEKIMLSCHGSFIKKYFEN